jgi:hypothetical protein
MSSSTGTSGAASAGANGRPRRPPKGYEPVLHYIRVPLDTAIFEEPAEDERLLLRIIGD